MNYEVPKCRTEKNDTMPSTFCLFLFFFFYHFMSNTLMLVVTTQAQAPAPAPSDACKSTLYPKLCRSILSTFHSTPSDPYDYGRFSIKQCLKQARRTSEVIDRYLTHKQRSALSHMEAEALDDCRQLSDLTTDYLDTISTELNSADSLTGELVNRVRTLLSAIVTNQQTCFDGLQDSGSSMLGALYEPLSNATELYSIALGLVTHSLARSQTKRKRIMIDHWIPSSLNRHWKTGFDFLRIAGTRRRNLPELMEGGILVNYTVTVTKDGSGNFTLIGDAITFAPNNSRVEDGYFVIYLKEGLFEEYVNVPRYKKNIMLLGDGINRTVITGNRSVMDGWTTFNSATFAVSGERFVAIDVTFKNTAGPEKHQAVAVRNNADLSTFYRCSFEGYQDTLYAHSLRQFYRDCDIYGTVDFIFGNSASVFQSCNLFARKPMANQKNAFTAQGRTDPNQNTGISIHNCSVLAAPDLAAAQDLMNSTTKSYLGRPWKAYSRTVYMQSFMDNVVDPVGWLEWNGTAGLDTLYYGEFENYGAGANTSMRVQWPGYNLMNASQAVNFTVYNFTMGNTWIPYTTIPYSGGLL